MTVDESSAALGARYRSRPQPAVSMRTAIHAGLCNRKTYKFVLVLYQFVVDFYLSLGIPRSEWEPQGVVVTKLTEEYVRRAHLTLSAELEDDLGPLNKVRELAGSVRRSLDRLRSWPSGFIAKSDESGTTRNLFQCVQLVLELSIMIEEDIREGYTYHRRTGELFRAFANKLPYGEAIGTIAFLAYEENINMLDPTANLLPWTAVVIVVLVVIIAQTRMVNNAAIDHNHAREYRAANRLVAEGSEANRNRNLIAAMVIAVALTAGLIFRATSTLNLGVVYVVITVLSVITGIGMPVLAFTAVAFDGSSLSRERDELAKSLADDKDAFDDLRADCRDSLSEMASLTESMRDRLPEILQDVQAELTAAQPDYTLLRLMIGLPNSNLESGEALGGRLSTGIPGAPEVDLRPFNDRVQALSEFDELRVQLGHELDLIPAHPWKPDDSR
jgi:hypothetical protein